MGYRDDRQPSNGAVTDPRGGSLAGPQALELRQLSWRGPFAPAGCLMQLRPARFDVVNAGAVPCTIETITLDPLSRDKLGTTIDAQLALHSQHPGSPLSPGEALTLTLSGTLPAEPGAYCTTARIITEGGGGLALPVALLVPAAPAWGIAAMLAGLLLLGTVNLLAGEGAVKTRLHDALQARQDIHAVLEATPAPDSRAGDIAAMDHDFDAAIEALGERRPVSLVDHRGENAQAALAEAATLANTLRAQVVGHPRGAAEIEDLRQDWKSMQPILQQIAALPAAQPPGETGLAGKLDPFLLQFRRRLLQAPAALVQSEINTELGRMDLELSAGEGDAARDLALTTRLWLRRSALFLNRSLTSYRSALVKAGWMLNTDTAIRDRAAHDDLSPDSRRDIVASLDAAAAQLDSAASPDTGAALNGFKEANRLFDQAWTSQVRGVTQTLKLRVDEAIAALNHQTDTSDVDAVLEQAQAAPKPHTPEMKQATFTQILALWRSHVAAQNDADFGPRLTHDIDALQTLVTAGRISEISPLYRTLLDDWNALSARQVQRAIARLNHPRCLEIFADLERDTAGIEAMLRERPPGQDLPEWDRKLDQIRLDMQRDGPDSETVTADCGTPLVAIEKRATDLSGAIFAASLIDVPLNALTRIRLAQASGVAEAIAATQANKDHPRALVLETVTPVAEQVTGRTLNFSVHGADPVWGSAALVTVAFGDGTPDFRANAEQLRQGKPIAHDYKAPLTAHLTVTAAEAPAANGQTGTLLGAGKATILIAPSQVTAAQRLADEFINLRFGLALLISLTVYYWRYHNRTSVFGARGYDYVEAFAVGFTADAAVSNFPDAIKAFAPT